MRDPSEAKAYNMPQFMAPRAPSRSPLSSRKTDARDSPSEPDQTTVTAAIETWFAKRHRDLPWRRTYDPYHVWISEIMLQQTRMEVVLRYYSAFLERFPDLETLAAASDEEVTARWSGLGYYRRSRMLRAGAVEVADRFAGRIPETVAELMEIPGIGRYTAGAIASIAFEKRAPIVDGNVARITARFYGIAAPLGSTALMTAAWARATELVAACSDPRLLNQGLMELGALICRPAQPDCPACPLRDECVALRTGRVSELPMPKATRATRQMDIPLYVIRDGRGRVLMRKESGPLMNAMYHLPHGATLLLPATPLNIASQSLLGTFRHTITDRRIVFSVFEAEASERIAEGQAEYEEYEWIDLRHLQEVPHSSYVRKALALLQKSERRR
jgi:A/G-specific adenine glycosylase